MVAQKTGDVVSSALRDKGRFPLVQNRPLVQLKVEQADVSNAGTNCLAAVFVDLGKRVVLASVNHQLFFTIRVDPEMHRLVNTSLCNIKRLLGLRAEHGKLAVLKTEHFNL